ncbi:MAG: hypothetical protein PUB54_02675 [Lachnospiraceae bacterium]|nr:hypothetical protein [Lachnospiraceae bacterium]
MNAKQKIHQAKLNHWMSLFQQQAASGLTIRQWCEQNNCSLLDTLSVLHLRIFVKMQVPDRRRNALVLLSSKIKILILHVRIFSASGFMSNS